LKLENAVGVDVRLRHAARMARPIRVEFEGAVYHVMARGNEWQAILRDDKDRQGFLDVLSQMVERFGVLLHVFCLMPNHLVVTQLKGGNNEDASGGWQSPRARWSAWPHTN
jgi:hypothetical protein